MPGVTVYLPSLTLSAELSLADRHREFPLLAWCLGGAQRTAHQGPLESMLAQQCGAGADFSLAHATARHDLGERGAAADLLRSDPVHLHADPNKVLVYGPLHLDLTTDEADSLLAGVNREFPELAMQRGVEITRWYVRRPAEVLGRAPSVQWLHGRSLTPFMPVAAEQRAWRCWLNDLQMVLHAHPTNTARMARGVLPVNGVWWFGAAESTQATRPRPVQMVGNDALLAGLSDARDAVWSATAAPAAALATGRDVVLVAGSAFGAAVAGNLISLEALEMDWLPVLVRALRRRQITGLAFMTGSHRGTLSWWQSLRRWTSPQAFRVE